MLFLVLIIALTGQFAFGMLQATFEPGDTIVVDVGAEGELTIERAAPAAPAKRQTAKAGR